MSQPSSAAAAAAVVVATADPTLGILSPISLSSLLARSLETVSLRGTAVVAARPVAATVVTARPAALVVR